MKAEMSSGPKVAELERAMLTMGSFTFTFLCL